MLGSRKGEIATIFTIGSLIILSVATIISSLALKKTYTYKSKAAGRCFFLSADVYAEQVNNGWRFKTAVKVNSPEGGGDGHIQFFINGASQGTMWPWNKGVNNPFVIIDQYTQPQTLANGENRVMDYAVKVDECNERGNYETLPCTFAVDADGNPDVTGDNCNFKNPPAQQSAGDGNTGNNNSSTCRDNPVSPPGGYSWVADCDGRLGFANKSYKPSCQSNNDCSQNTKDPNVNASNTNWCYEFKNGASGELRCLMLLKNSTSNSGNGSGSGGNQSGQCSPKNSVIDGQYCLKEQCVEVDDKRKWIMIEKYCDNDGKIIEKAGTVTNKECEQEELGKTQQCGLTGSSSQTGNQQTGSSGGGTSSGSTSSVNKFCKLLLYSSNVFEGVTFNTYKGQYKEDDKYNLLAYVQPIEVGTSNDKGLYTSEKEYEKGWITIIAKKLGYESTLKSYNLDSNDPNSCKQSFELRKVTNTSSSNKCVEQKCEESEIKYWTRNDQTDVFYLNEGNCNDRKSWFNNKDRQSVCLNESQQLNYTIHLEFDENFRQHLSDSTLTLMLGEQNCFSILASCDRVFYKVESWEESANWDIYKSNNKYIFEKTYSFLLDPGYFKNPGRLTGFDIYATFSYKTMRKEGNNTIRWNMPQVVDSNRVDLKYANNKTGFIDLIK